MTTTPEKIHARLSYNDQSHRVRVHACAYGEYSHALYVLSCTCQGRIARVVNIVLNDNGGVMLEGLGAHHYGLHMRLHDDHYTIKKHHIGYDVWHVVAMAKDPKLMLAATPGAVWNAISSDRFTTPVLESWSPGLLRRMKADRLLDELQTYNCQASLLDCEDYQLDEIVTDMVGRGKLVIE